MARTSPTATSAASAPGSCSSRASWTPYLGARLGPEPLGPLSAARLGERLDGRRAPLKSALLDQRTIAGPREHLRRRGAVAEPAAPAAGRRQPRRESSRRLHRAIRRVLRQGARAPGLDAPRLRAARRRLRRDAGRVPGLRARGRAVRPLRHAPRANRGRRAHDDVLPALPAARTRAASSRPTLGDASSERCATPRAARRGRPERSSAASSRSRRPARRRSSRAARSTGGPGRTPAGGRPGRRRARPRS